MKKYENYTEEELKNSDVWTKFKIVVPTIEDKQELEEALNHIHYSDIDTDIIAVNQIAHLYLNEDEGYINNIIVDEELFNKLPKYKKADGVSEVKTFESFNKVGNSLWLTNEQIKKNNE